MPAPRLPKRLKRFLRSESGATAVEFVLILPPMILLTLGVINLSVMMYAASALHFAAEDAARCAAVKKDICNNPTATATYAVNAYNGPGPTPTFIQSTTACGNTVSGSVTYNFSTGLTNSPFLIQAKACYPDR